MTDDEALRRLERAVAQGDRSRGTADQLRRARRRAGIEVWISIYGTRHRLGDADCKAGRCGRGRPPVSCRRCGGRVHAASSARSGRRRVRRRCEECGHTTTRTDQAAFGLPMLLLMNPPPRR